MLSGTNRKLILEDGSVYEGYAFGASGEKIVEIVFNTSLVGYQEILSDPSYTDQGVVMTYPLIGNYGMADDDYETETPTIGALIVREYCGEPSNFRSTRTLGDVMTQYGIVGLGGVDTRSLTRHIRNFGSCKGWITDLDTPTDATLLRLRAAELPRDSVSRVSRRQTVRYAGENAAYHVVAVDCGMKQNIVRSMQRKGCDVTVVPWNTDAAAIAALHPDGVFLSNGPGDPTDVPELIETVRQLIGRFPFFGICLGHQILSLAYGAKTYKLKFGHRGGNHPVKDLDTDKLEITSQNHSYAVDMDSLSATPLRVTHINLLDNTVEGVACARDKAFGVQYHPESAPGPQDSAYLFDRFIALMKEARNDA
ncbi:MAG: glutamine-hydrolyzing carbamoyl-phosphate synthase small subunit [Clostridia bacterium]|nr:glutamine-hydrolyzing carbamoyl-phosphate synthase small subunit [Clostridia bacterium]